MTTGKVVVKLLKPDGAGHMQRIFNYYLSEIEREKLNTNISSNEPGSSSASSSSPSLDYPEFTNLLIDLVGTDAAGIDAKSLYEVSNYT